MKLIDLLVQELPKRGGWPDFAEVAVQDSDSQICFSSHSGVYTNKEKTDWYGGDWGSGDWRNPFIDILADDRHECIVTRKQYEAALAASQNPAWNGEGLPPVGCECEVSVDGGRSWCTYRAINEKNGVRLIEIGSLTEEFENNNWIFRPLPTESERKRNAAAKEMARHANSDEHRKFNAGLRNCLSIYDAIAAGKIPGVKLDD